MTYRLRNIIVAVSLALVAALLTSFYVSNYQRSVRKGEANVAVFVAAKDIPVGTAGAELARGRSLKKTEVAKRSVVPGSITDPAQLDQLVASQQILAGEQVTTRRFATPTEQGVSAQLKGTMRAIQVPGDSNQLLAGTLKAGDRIDVVASLKLGGAQEFTATRIVLRDIEVLEAPTGGTTDVELAGRVESLRAPRRHGHAGAEALPRDDPRPVVVPAPTRDQVGGQLRVRGLRVGRS